MKISKIARHVVSLMMAMIIIVAMLPLGAMAAEDSVVVIAASDYQLSNSGTIMTNIMNQIKEDYGTPYGALLGGDYDAGSVSTKASHIQAVDDVISSVFPGIASDKRIYIQGNHENYAGLKVDGTNLMNYTGAYDTEYYGVYAFNHDNFPWSTSSNPSSSSSLVQATADALGDYLEAKVAEGYEKPVFVMSHLPLHAARNDNYYARYIFDELEAAGEAGLNIIFLCGHNHSGGYDAYLGNGSFYLPVGSSLTVVDGKSGTYTDDSISFTYMNYGYLGKVGGSGGCTHQSMTVFEITGDQVSIKRYDESGLHKLKAAGVASGSYAANTTEIGTEGAIIELGEPVPAVTLTDNNVTVTSAGLTGLSVTKVFGTSNTESYDSATYAAYASYDITPEGYTQGKSATVTVQLDAADGFDASKTVVVIDKKDGSEKRLNIENGAVTFTTNHFSTYDIAQRSASAGYNYELVDTIVAGKSYVIVGNDNAVALMDNSGSLGSQEVTISGTSLNAEVELTEWTFSSATSGTITSSEGRKLGYSSSSWNLTGSGDCSFDIGTGSGNFSLRVIRASSGYNRYYFNYDGSGWTSKPTSAAYVRLYQLVSAGSGTTDPSEPSEPTDPTEPSEPEVTPDVEGTIWRQVTSITDGKKYMLVNYGYNDSGVDTYAVNSEAGATQVEVLSDTKGAYIINDDDALVWNAASNSSQFLMTSAENGNYLRSGTYVSGSTGSDLSVSSTNSSGSNYSNWSMETNSSKQVLAVRRATSSNYYPVCYNSGKFQAFNSSQVSSRNNWLTIFEETAEVSHTHAFETVTVEATCTENGSVTTSCACGEKTVETIEALGHDYACVETAATCGQDGAKVYTCGRCGDTYTEVIAATGAHTNETITVDANCTEAGSVTTKCTVCGKETVEVIEALGHKCESVRVEPTCVAAGSITHTCAVCGDSYVDSLSATGKHIYKSETVEATCTKDGAVIYSCAFCDHSYSETIQATGHNYSCTVQEATCTVPGSSVYTCDSCGDSYSEEIPATGHDYASVVTDATCTAGGFTTYTCVGCGDSYVSDYTDALGHSYEKATVEPTCTEDGSITYYCACGDQYVETIPSTGHSYRTVVTAPNCTEGGYTTHTCTVCGDSYVTDSVAALGHNYESVVVEPTCTVGGYTSNTCTVCGEHEIVNETAALGHDYVSVTVDPTETEGGYTTHTCNTCGHSYTDNFVDALGHAYVSVVTEPTCEKQGYTTHTCTVCGEVIVDSYVDALGHNYQTVTVDATCTTDGSVTKTCATCGETSTEVIGAYGHKYATSVTAPTCTEGGHTVYSCGRCGDNYISDYTEALGHNYTSIITDVTCTQDGYTTHLCTNCGDSYVGETVEALGHKYETVTTDATCTENGAITHICANCGDSYSEVIEATGHDYQAVVTKPTCTEEGYTTYTCHCGDSYISDKTLAVGHSYTSREENGNLVYTCEHCGDSYTVTVGWVAVPGIYVLDTDGIETGADHKYIVVGADKDYALTLTNNTIGAAQVTVSGNTIRLDDGTNYEFYFADNSSKESGTYLLTRDGNKGVYHVSGNINYGHDSKGYWYIKGGSNGQYQVYDYDNMNWYLNYGYVWANNSVSRFAVSSNARNVRLFKAADGYVRLYGVLDQTMVHGYGATEEAVLAKLQIQLSDDGITVADSVAVTSDMLTWDKAFDGNTAGTYTAVVNYNGTELGTVTVNVTGEHIYETEVVEPTCEEQGYTVHTCTACGTSYKDAYIEALGHNYTTEADGNKVIYTCQRCGDSYTESTVSYKQVSSIASGNNYVVTLYSGSKYYALSHKNNSISVTQITVSDGEITSEITEDMLWSYSGSKLSYTSNGTTYYLYAKPASGWWGWWSTPTLTISSSNSSTVSFSSSKLKVGNHYLYYSNGAASLNNSSTTSYVFLEQ